MKIILGGLPKQQVDMLHDEIDHRQNRIDILKKHNQALQKQGKQTLPEYKSNAKRIKDMEGDIAAYRKRLERNTH